MLKYFVSVPNYGFNYAVNDPVTGDNKAQSEVREGDVVRGSYSLAEPDGTVRIVEYTADPVSGFNAVVKRVGQAVHPPQALTPVVTKAVPSQIIAPAPQISHAPVQTDLAYGGLDGYWDGGLNWGGLGLGLGGVGDHGHWSH
ncbi:unnamed protein product, partial [Iphiclides podalirius]